MKKILIIEDDIDLLENTSDFLKEEGFETLTAENGTIGVQKALLKIPDLIVCDIAMPEMDGFEVYKTLQEISATVSIPFIFLTAKTERDDIRTGMQMGADDYITKPFDFDELLSAINIRLEKKEKLEKTYDERFFALVDNSFSGTIVLRDDHFEYVNNKFSKITGYSKEELSEMRFIDIVANEDKKTIDEKMKRSIKSLQNSIQFTFTSLTKKHKKIDLELVGSVIKTKGKPQLVANVINQTDIQSQTKEEFIKQHSTDFVKLSKREQEVLELICKGFSNHEIAEHLFISHRTVDKHRANLISKTNSKNTADLVMFAVKNNFIEI